MSSSRKVRVSLTWWPALSDHVPVSPSTATPWRMKPSGASTSRTSCIPRWSRTRRWSGGPPRNPGAGSPRRSASSLLVTARIGGPVSGVSFPLSGRSTPRPFAALANVRRAPRPRVYARREGRTRRTGRGGRQRLGRRSDRSGKQAGNPRVVDDQGRVGPDGPAVGQLRDPLKDPRREGRSVDPGLLRILRRLGDRRHGVGPGQLVVGGDRHAEQNAGPEPEPEVHPDEAGGSRQVCLL